MSSAIFCPRCHGQGYNDGLTGSGDGSESVTRRLSPEGAAAEEFSEKETADITADSYRAGLDRVHFLH